MNKRVLSLVYDITFSFSCLSLASFTQLSSLAYSFISDLEMFVSFKALFLSLFSWQAVSPPGSFIYADGIKYVLHDRITTVMTYTCVFLAWRYLQTYVRCFPIPVPCFMGKPSL